MTKQNSSSEKCEICNASPLAHGAGYHAHGAGYHAHGAGYHAHLCMHNRGRITTPLLLPMRAASLSEQVEAASHPLWMHVHIGEPTIEEPRSTTNEPCASEF